MGGTSPLVIAERLRDALLKLAAPAVGEQHIVALGRESQVTTERFRSSGKPQFSGPLRC